MGVGDKITAVRFNNIRKKVAAVMGAGGQNPDTGSNDDAFGYGQTLTSVDVDQFAKVTLTDVHNLRTDLVKMRQHQTGQTWSSLPISNSEYLAIFSKDSKVTETDVVKYETAATNGVTNRFAIGSTPNQQFFIESRLSFPQGGIISQRTAEWTTSVKHEVFVDFVSYAQARYFFNSGGEIIFTPTLNNGNGNSKYLAWRNLLNVVVKELRFGYNYITSTGTAGTVAKGFYQLTVTNQELFKKSSSPSYTENSYTINGKFADSTKKTLVFEIIFDDAHLARTEQRTDGITIFDITNPDEPVTGTLISEVTQRRPSGDNVNVVGPAYRNGITL